MYRWSWRSDVCRWCLHGLRWWAQLLSTHRALGRLMLARETRDTATVDVGPGAIIWFAASIS